MADLTTRTGIKLLRSHTTVTSRGSGITITMKDDDEGRAPRRPARRSAFEAGLLFVAALDQTDWETGEKGSLTRAIAYQPIELVAAAVRRAPRSTGALLVKIWAAVGVVFAVMYCVALVLGAAARALDHAQRARAVARHRAAAPGRLHAPDPASAAATSWASWPSPST